MNPTTRAASIRDRITKLRTLADGARELAARAAERDQYARENKCRIAADTADDRADHLEHVLRSLTIDRNAWQKE